MNSFDLNRITTERVANVAAATKTWTKPAGARSFRVYCEEAYRVVGGDETTVHGGSTVAAGATVGEPYPAQTRSDIYPCGGLANVLVMADTGNLSVATITWFY